jgi:hypothetical protein
MNPGFISRDNAHKKLFTLNMTMCQESSVTLHTLQLVFIGQLSRHPPGAQIVMFECLMDDAMCRSNANVQHSGSSIHRNLPICTNKCVHVSSVGITDSCA